MSPFKQSQDKRVCIVDPNVIVREVVFIFKCKN